MSNRHFTKAKALVIPLCIIIKSKMYLTTKKTQSHQEGSLIIISGITADKRIIQNFGMVNNLTNSIRIQFHNRKRSSTKVWIKANLIRTTTPDNQTRQEGRILNTKTKSCLNRWAKCQEMGRLKGNVATWTTTYNLRILMPCFVHQAHMQDKSINNVFFRNNPFTIENKKSKTNQFILGKPSKQEA